MTTAVDTNVLIALLAGDSPISSAARLALETAAARGPLIVSPAVYSELVAGQGPAAVNAFLSEAQIEVDWVHPASIWRVAGERYGAYAQDRRNQRGDPGPRRILADFLIGAHATHMAQAFITSDTRVFNTYFPELRVATLHTSGRQ